MSQIYEQMSDQISDVLLMLDDWQCKAIITQCDLRFEGGIHTGRDRKFAIREYVVFLVISQN